MQVCGDFKTITDRCAAMYKGGKCVAFTYESSSKCAYLKYASSPYVSRQGWILYESTGATATTGR